MAIDVRATVTCSLGTLISGNIADGYIQGNGLVLVRGSVEISGLITPAVGTAVTFAYKINGGTRNIPRKLRVLSSFADPFRRTTKVELGCKLTYLSDLREKLKWSAFDDPENAIDYDPADYEVIPVPVRASSMMARCLTELGITASSNPLTNRFSAGQYDFSAGWVTVLNQLLVSEGYCGYLDRSEVLQVFALNQDGGTGPVVTVSKIIDIGAINAGQLPGEAVTVSYSALRFKAQPEPETWKKSSTSNRSSVTIKFRNPITQAQESRFYDVLETEEETSEFQTLTKQSTEEKVSVVRYRKTVRTESSPKALSSLMVQFLEAGVTPPTAQLQTTTEEWFYYDAEAVEVRSVKETYASQAYAYGQVSLPMVFDNAGVKTTVSIPFGSTYLQEAIETETLVQGSLRKVITRKYGNWIATIAGQQAVAESRESFTTATQVASYMNETLAGKYLISTDIRTEENTSSGQRVPFGSAALVREYNKDGTRKTSKTELVLALGSATAQRRVEFTLPMAPDDVIIKDGGSYKVVPNNAYNKAKAYGIIQNRLLLGNRNGMNVRLNALQMPEAPFLPLVVQAGGLAALYRTNGTSWTFNAEGVMVSTDALFWGAVGGSGSFWFPVAPGVTNLPSTPATSTVNITGTADGGGTVTVGTQAVLTASGVVAPYNETSVLVPTVRAGLVVASLPYSLTASTAVSVVTRAIGLTQRVRLINIPTANIAIAASVPIVSGGAAVRPPAVSISIAAVTPIVSGGGSVAVPVADITLGTPIPDQIGRPKKQVFIPAVDIAVAAVLPTITSGGSVAPPVATVSVAGEVPSGIGVFDRNFSSVSLLLHMDGSNNSTTFTDSSSNAFSATAYGNAKITTAQSKYGGASGLFDGSGDYLGIANNSAFNFGTGDFTIEAWIYLVANSGDFFIASSSGGGGLFFGYRNSTSPVGWGVGRTEVAWDYVSGSTSSTGSWNHIAVSRQGTTLRLFVNGTQVGSTTNSQSYNLSTTSLTIASQGANYYLNGYIDDLRITNGIARYTASFTAPTAAFLNR